MTGGAITGFSTFLTGEMFALLRQHSIIGRLIPPGPVRRTSRLSVRAFRLALRVAHAGCSTMSSPRVRGLLGEFGPDEIAERLSGILIGHEIRAGLASAKGARQKVLLVGEAALLARYRVAFTSLGLEAGQGPEHAAVEGFRRLGVLGRTG